MFGFGVKTFANGMGSPSASPASFGLPALPESPKAEIGEIDTRAPFESVKAARSLFGESSSSRALPVTKKTKAEEQKLLEREAQHHMMLKELDHYKEQLRNIEGAKAKALRDLQLAKRTVQELTNKLEALSESKQAEISAKEAAKSRAQMLDEQKPLLAELGDNAWKARVNTERELYKTSSRELISSKQELTNLRQDFDVALEAKLAAFQQAENAVQAARENQETQEQLEAEFAMLSKTLDQVKLTSLHAEEEHMKLISEKEIHLIVHKGAKEAAEQEIQRLKEADGHKENLQEKLEETTEAIKVLQEQLKEVRAADLSSLRGLVSELASAKKELQEAAAEQASVRSSLGSLNLQLREMQWKLSESKKFTSEAEPKIEQMQADLENAKAELDAAMSRNVTNDMQLQLGKLLKEAGEDRNKAEETMKEVELLHQEAEAANAASKEANEKLDIALKEAEAAKVKLKHADAQIYNSSRDVDGDDPRNLEPHRTIKLSNDEFKSMNKRIEEFRKQADAKEAVLMSQMQNINARENQVQRKVQELLKECEVTQSEIEDVVKQAEGAEAARAVVQGELRKWREAEEGSVRKASYIPEVK